MRDSTVDNRVGESGILISSGVQIRWLVRIMSIVFVLLFPLVSLPQSVLVDKVIAKVGSEIILLSEMEEEFQFALSKDPSLSEDIKCDILDNLIAQKLIVYQAIVDSVDVSDVEVDLQLDYRFDAILRQMNGDEDFFKEYYGASVDEMKTRFRDDQKQKILAEKMQGKLISEIEITPREVEQFFKRVPADSLPYFKSEMEISEIVMMPQVNDKEKATALEKITGLRQKILSGEATFEEVASRNSMDPGSAIRGGDLGFAKRGNYVPEFEAALFSLAKDEISEVIETEFGFHFIQLLERRGNSVRARHVLIKPAITSDDMALTKAKIDSVRALVLSDSLTFEAAVKEYSFKDMPSYANGGRVKNPSSNNTFFAADDLDPDTYFAIFDKKPGDISEPLQVTMPDGSKGYRIVQLNSVSKPHKANLKEDFDKISNYAKESKKNEYFYKWLNAKRKQTFIYVDPMFGHCGLENKGKI